MRLSSILDVSVCSAASLAAALLLFPPPAAAQATTPIQIDASQPFVEPGPATYDEQFERSPSGQTIGVNSRYLTLHGTPWFPVMGEFHFSRYPRDQWEQEILKMKASGVNVVAAYVIWIHHEEIQGQFDWSGQRDLRAFVQLCAKHDMYIVPRIGPWDHAEVRNGGFPDWVVKSGPTRENDPTYLQYVSAWYAQIAKQLDGLLWKDGGPIVGIQLENEYAKRGPGAGDAHILELKKIAQASGIDVPLYFVTGWDNAVVPTPAVLPVYGGYPAAPWDGSITRLPPSEVYAFRFGSRVSGNMGMMGARSGSENKTQVAVPFLTAEVGGGIEDTYHRRPIIQPDDIAAMFPVMLGSGVNLYGTYMFHGGENPEGKLTTLQESQATDYPNDLPVKSYDFQAPLGEFGQERASLRKMKVFQYFLNTFGADLAPMEVHAPAERPKNPADFSVPRTAFRSQGDEGFLFFNNYVRNYEMPARPGTQFQIHLPSGTVQLPRHPVDIPAGAYFIWPINLPIDGVTLRYSTAQPFTTIADHAGHTTVFFEAIPGIAPEFAFDSTARVTAPSDAKIETESGVQYVTGLQPGVDAAIEVHAPDGASVRFVVLTAEEAEDAWRVRLGGEEHLLLTSQDFFADQDGPQSQIGLRSTGDPHFRFTVIPPPSSPLTGSVALRQLSISPNAATYAAEEKPCALNPQVRPIREEQPVPPVKIGPRPNWRPNGVAEAPDDAAFAKAAQWSIDIPADALHGLSEVFLEIHYKGDVARLNAGQRLLDDNFFNGQPWQIGLRRFLDPAKPSHFTLEILPLRADAPIYLQDAPKINPGGQIDTLDSVRLIPQYQLTVTGAK